jgi:hypothetical protein
MYTSYLHSSHVQVLILIQQNVNDSLSGGMRVHVAIVVEGKLIIIQYVNVL